MSRLPISVFIIAKNEADRISHAINSVRGWVDEVIVIDSGSEDDTVQVSQSLGARVEFRTWEGYGPQKVYGESLCRNDWLLNIDADEEISPALTQEIQALFAQGTPPLKGYRLRILALYRFQEKLPFFAAGTTQLRLYHRAYAGFKDAYVHDSVVMKDGGKTRLLKSPVLHRSFRSYSHTIEKIHFYTTMQAEDLFRRGKNPSPLKIIFTPPLALLKCYFLRKYMFYGIDGVIHSWHYAYGRLLRLAKTREMFQEEQYNKNHSGLNTGK